MTNLWYPKQNPLVGLTGMGGGAGSYFVRSATGAAEDYKIPYSLRFKRTSGSDGTSMLQQLNVAGDPKKFTLSFWYKGGNHQNAGSAGFGGVSIVSAAAGNAGNVHRDNIGFLETDHFQVSNNDTSGWQHNTSTRLFRDYGAWYHFVVKVDTANATANQRTVVWVNGERIDMTANISQNKEFAIGKQNYYMNWGRYTGENRDHLMAYLADCQYYDGSALDVSTFGYWSAPHQWTAREAAIQKVNAGTTWSSTCTASNGFYSGNPATKGFDGNLGGSDHLLGDYSAGNSRVTFTPPTPIPFSTIRVYGGRDSALKDKNACQINGVNVSDYWSNGDGWKNFTNLPGVTSPLTSISALAKTSGQVAYWMAIEIDGKILVDGATDSTTLSFGDKGSHLKFEDASALGTDSSDNSNNWTPNNFTTTDGWDDDQFRDTPIPYEETEDDITTVRGNFCTLNNNDRTNAITSSGTLSNGDTGIVSSSGTWRFIRGSMTLDGGKWYWECQVPGGTDGSNGWQMGLLSKEFRNTLGQDVNSDAQYYWGRQTDARYNNNVGGNGANSNHFDTNPATGHWVMFAYDADAGKMWTGANGVWDTCSGSPNPATGTDPHWTGMPSSGLIPSLGIYGSSLLGKMRNGGNGYAHTPPTGFKPLCNNYLAPAVGIGASHFEAVSYAGDGLSGQKVNQYRFSPSLVWTKRYNGTAWWNVFDRNRGVSTDNCLFLNATNAASDRDTQLTSFNSDGWTLGTNGDSNHSDGNFISYAWHGGSSQVTDTVGDVNVSRWTDTTAGVSVMYYTGNGQQSCWLGHGLGKVPAFVIVKANGGSYEWIIKHQFNSSDKIFYLGGNAGTGAESTPVGGNQGKIANLDGASTTKLKVEGEGGNLHNVNVNGQAYVMYAFAEIPGFSSFGQYYGRTDMTSAYPFIPCGFTPRFIIGKTRDVGPRDWYIHDSQRDPRDPIGYNERTKCMLPNLDSAEVTQQAIDMVSNGFKIRNNSGGSNGNANYYVYAAWARNPFKHAMGE